MPRNRAEDVALLDVGHAPQATCWQRLRCPRARNQHVRSTARCAGAVWAGPQGQQRQSQFSPDHVPFNPSAKYYHYIHILGLSLWRQPLPEPRFARA
eukprot:scaffold31041_cov69-Phaeocystis_antarctica.AAC.6